MNQHIGKWLMILGILLLVAGIIYYYAGDKLRWIGNLPGDFKVEKENFKFYFPLTTMILLSLLIHLISRIINYIK